MAKKGSSKPVIQIDNWATVLPKEGEDFTGRKSLAIPDQTLSVREIVDNHTRGITDFPESELVFLNDEEIPNFENMSKIDQLLYAAEMRHLVAVRQKALEDAQAAGETVKEEDYSKLTPTQPVEQPEDE